MSEGALAQDAKKLDVQNKLLALKRDHTNKWQGDRLLSMWRGDPGRTARCTFCVRGRAASGRSRGFPNIFAVGPGGTRRALKVSLRSSRRL